MTCRAPKDHLSWDVILLSINDQSVSETITCKQKLRKPVCRECKKEENEEDISKEVEVRWSAKVLCQLSQIWFSAFSEPWKHSYIWVPLISSISFWLFPLFDLG